MFVNQPLSFDRSKAKRSGVFRIGARRYQITAMSSSSLSRHAAREGWNWNFLQGSDAVERRMLARNPICADTFSLTFVTVYVTYRFNLAREGRPREVDLGAGASAVPAGGVTTRTRAVSGISLLALQTRPRGARWAGTGEGG
jgi:hypothetical protein